MKTPPLSWSGRSDFARCHRLYLLSRIKRIELDLEVQPRRMGKAFARALELNDPDIVDAEYSDAPEEMDMEREQVRLLADLYLKRYQDPPELVTEYEFRTPIAGHGFLDGVLETSTERVGIECKLLSPYYWRDAEVRKLAIDGQVTSYFMAMRELGKPLDRLLYRVTMKPTIKQDSRKNESLTDYLDRLRAKIAEDPDKVFRQYELYRTNEELDRFQEEVADINRQLRAAKKANVWTRNTGSCTMFGECAMLSLCRDEPGAAQKYRIKPLPPKLTEPQRLVLEAMGKSIAQAVNQTSLRTLLETTGAGISKCLLKLEAMELIERVSPFDYDKGISIQGNPDGSQEWKLTSAGQDIASKLNPKATPNG